MDDARLREPENFLQGLFEEQLERIRDIRASEKVLSENHGHLFPVQRRLRWESPITKEFFATVQNKLHYAVTHHTAAEDHMAVPTALSPTWG